MLYLKKERVVKLKKYVSIILALIMILSFVPHAFAEGITLNPAKADDKSSSLKFSAEGAYFNNGDYFGFCDVDLTGIKSVTIEASCVMPYGSNGEAVAIKRGGKQGELLGYVVINDEDDEPAQPVIENEEEPGDDEEEGNETDPEPEE